MSAEERHLQALVHESLALFLYDNAKFLCERLVASFRSEARAGGGCCGRTLSLSFANGPQHPLFAAPLASPRVLPQSRLHPQWSQANLYLLATCYVHANQAYRAYHLLAGACAAPPACRRLSPHFCAPALPLPKRPADAARRPSAPSAPCCAATAPAVPRVREPGRAGRKREMGC